MVKTFCIWFNKPFCIPRSKRYSVLSYRTFTFLLSILLFSLLILYFCAWCEIRLFFSLSLPSFLPLSLLSSHLLFFLSFLLPSNMEIQFLRHHYLKVMWLCIWTLYSVPSVSLSIPALVTAQSWLLGLYVIYFFICQNMSHLALFQVL